MKIMGCEVIEKPILKGMEIAIKQGDKLYVWPEFVMPKELKYIEVATQEEQERELMKLRVDFYESWETVIPPSIFHRKYFNPFL